MPDAVPEGADPSAQLIYLTSAGGALVGVDPLTGAVKASASGSTAGGSAGRYGGRGGGAPGLGSGQGGGARGLRSGARRGPWADPRGPGPPRLPGPARP